MSLQPLICRLPLLPGESLPSLLARLARENEYEPPSLLLGLLREPEESLKIRLVCPMRASTFERIVSLSCISPYELYKATAHSFTQVLTPPESTFEYLELCNDAHLPLLSYKFAALHLRPDSKGQFCSLCLKENAYHQIIWLSNACSACLKHKILLDNTCPECREAVRIRDIIDRNCSKCRTDLSEALPNSVKHDAFGLFAQAAIQSWLTQCNNPLPTVYFLPKQTPRVLYRVLDKLKNAIQKVSKDWPFLHRIDALEYSLPLSIPPETRTLTPYESYCIYATAFKGIIDWPNGFNSFLTAYRDRNRKNSSNDDQHLGGVQEILGAIYKTCIYGIRREPSLQFVKDAIGRYLIENQISLHSSKQFMEYKRRTSLNEMFSGKFVKDSFPSFVELQ